MRNYDYENPTMDIILFDGDVWTAVSTGSDDTGIRKYAIEDDEKNFQIYRTFK
ncbi:MAG: hypothetical protein LUG49_06865 [Oscillospiraceae bacterium]|nr:hypothetical protein [Oscillospiraceae bacterium]